jgi:hypothetical protein
LSTFLLRWGNLCAADSVLGNSVIDRFDAESRAHSMDPARGGRYPATHAYAALVRSSSASRSRSRVVFGDDGKRWRCQWWRIVEQFNVP